MWGMQRAMNADGHRQLQNFLRNHWPIGYKGFFIEAGANDGKSQSNTRGLQKRGWYGLLVEPREVEFGKCFINRMGSRVERCALVSHDYKKPTIEGYFGGDGTDINGDHESLISQVKGHGQAWPRTEKFKETSLIDVPALTLDAVLDTMKEDPADPWGREISHIDFFSLDVEGYELEVLKGLDLNKNGPTLICVEIHPDSGLFPHIMNWLIVRHDYEMALKLGGDIDFLFKRKRKPWELR